MKRELWSACVSKRIRTNCIILIGLLISSGLHATAPATSATTAPTTEVASAISPSVVAAPAPVVDPNIAMAPATQPAASELDVWMVVAAVALLLCLALAALLLLLVRRWRAAFQTKEWLLLPDDAGRRLEIGLRELQGTFVKTVNQLAKHVEQSASNSEQAATVTKGLREEFTILRSELEFKSKQIAELQLGRDFLSKKSVLIRAIKALEIIETDRQAGVSPEKTLEGVRIELDECLEDNGVETASPVVGEKISDPTLIDARAVQRQDTSDPAQKGSVASVSRPAFVAKTISGRLEVLSPARVTIYV